MVMPYNDIFSGRARFAKFRTVQKRLESASKPHLNYTRSSEDTHVYPLNSLESPDTTKQFSRVTEHQVDRGRSWTLFV